MLLETPRLLSLVDVDMLEEGEELVSEGSLLRREVEVVLIVFVEIDGKGMSQATKSIGSTIKKIIFGDDFIEIL